MMAVPALFPNTSPPELTVATKLLLHDQLPPVARLLNNEVVPAHSTGVPIMVPAFGNGFTVNSIVSTAVPQVLVTL